MAKGVQISYNPFPRASGKIQLLSLGFALASYCILPAAIGSGLYITTTYLPSERSTQYGMVLILDSQQGGL